MTHPATPNFAAPDSAPPDWSTHPDPVPCPLCSYDLRNLPTPRCPECGYSFTWAGLLEARRTTHPYLFEHHPDRNLRSFLRTSLASCLPRRFWRSLSAAHPIRPRRLLLYWLLTCLPLTTLLLAALALNTWLYRERYTFYTGSVVPDYTFCLAATWRDYGPTTLAYALWLAWPFATAASLLAYRRSMCHAAIRPAHVLRCTLYSADLLLWPGLALLAYLAWTWGQFAWENHNAGAPLFGYWSYAPRRLTPSTTWTWHALILLATYRLTVAYARYLRFDKAWLAVPLAATASLLLLWIVYLTLATPEGLYHLPIWGY